MRLGKRPEALPAAEANKDLDLDREDAERKAQIERIRQHLKSGKAARITSGHRLVESNLDIVEPVIEDGVVVDVVEVEDDKQSLSATAEPIEHGESNTPSPAPTPVPKVGDRVFVSTCPHTDKYGFFAIKRIEGEKARLRCSRI